MQIKLGDFSINLRLVGALFLLLLLFSSVTGSCGFFSSWGEETVVKSADHSFDALSV